MRCKKVLELLDDHIDGLLPAPVAEEIRDHLDLCQECRETSLAMKAASASLARWSDVEPSDRCFDEILAKLEALPVEAYERPVARPVSRIREYDAGRTRWFATSGLAAAAAVLAAIVISRSETHVPVKRARTVPSPIAVDAGSWFQQGYDFDNGLFYQGPTRATAQPVRAGVRSTLLEAGAPR
jgi:anti-sigma factor RsiW